MIQGTEHLLFVQHKLMGENMKSYLMFPMIHLNSIPLPKQLHLRLEGYRVEWPKKGFCNMVMKLKHTKPL